MFSPYYNSKTTFPRISCSRFKLTMCPVLVPNSTIQRRFAAGVKNTGSKISRLDTFKAVTAKVFSEKLTYPLIEESESFQDSLGF